MAYALSIQREASRDIVLQILSRLWQTKLRSISILEKWLEKTADAEIIAGLKPQLIDERRHLRILGDEIKRLGGSIAALSRENRLGRPFALVQTQPNDFYRLSAFHFGSKAFTLDRCGHMMQLVDIRLGRTLEQIVLDEERHIRWADIRLARLKDVEELRLCQQLMERVGGMLEGVWPKPWLELNRRRAVSIVARR
ncbi:MAG: hypothetical protein GEU75_03335 [Dehalococcoidia bacterium]|nr:hypothetical protein [Dehalococcoidia bacterium]